MRGITLSLCAYMIFASAKYCLCVRFSIAIVHLLLLLWQLNVSIEVQWHLKASIDLQWKSGNFAIFKNYRKLFFIETIKLKFCKQFNGIILCMKRVFWFGYLSIFIAMATSNLHRLIMGKVEIVIHCCVTGVVHYQPNEICCCCVRFYVPPTAKVIRRRDLGLKSHPKDCN